MGIESSFPQKPIVFPTPIFAITLQNPKNFESSLKLMEGKELCYICINDCKGFMYNLSNQEFIFFKIPFQILRSSTYLIKDSTIFSFNSISNNTISTQNYKILIKPKQDLILEKLSSKSPKDEFLSPGLSFGGFDYIFRFGHGVCDIYSIKDDQFKLELFSPFNFQRGATGTLFNQRYFVIFSDIENIVIYLDLNNPEYELIPIEIEDYDDYECQSFASAIQIDFENILIFGGSVKLNGTSNQSYLFNFEKKSFSKTKSQMTSKGNFMYCSQSVIFEECVWALTANLTEKTLHCFDIVNQKWSHKNLNKILFNKKL